MANSWKWWICVVVSDDYYTYYNETELVKGRSAREAINRALRGHYSSAYVEDAFGPFKEKPQEWEV